MSSNSLAVLRRTLRICLAGASLLAATGRAQPAPPSVAREFRAAWVSPVEAGDWPSRPGLTVEEQRAELRSLMDSARANGLNAIVLHVRPAADALYPTSKAPWSRYLVGRGDAWPSDMYDGYDPLALAIAEAHARGLQLHAWFNPFRAMPPDDLGPPGRDDLARAHPEWVRTYGRSTWIDPGIPAARRAVLDAILEVVDRYDVDGVHLDDYFYPYREERTVTRTVRRGKRRIRISRRVPIEFPDATSWKRYGRAKGWTSREDWRRANVNDFIRTLYREVKARKSWVLVGVSPFGIWRPGYPQGITGLDAYTEIFADSRRWLREGWLDYLAPQLYWSLDGAQSRFTRLDDWWRSENRLGRHIWPGLFTMRVGSVRDPWQRDAIAAEVVALRGARAGTNESLGHIHFRMGTLATELPGETVSFGETLHAAVYVEPALPPASPWLGAATPTAPRLVVVDDASLELAGDAPNDSAHSAARGSRWALSFNAADTVTVRWWLVQRLGIDGRWRSQLLPSASSRLPFAPDDTTVQRTAVTAISPTGMASAPSFWPADTATKR